MVIEPLFRAEALLYSRRDMEGVSAYIPGIAGACAIRYGVCSRCWQTKIKRSDFFIDDASRSALPDARDIVSDKPCNAHRESTNTSNTLTQINLLLLSYLVLPLGHDLLQHSLQLLIIYLAQTVEIRLI